VKRENESIWEEFSAMAATGGFTEDMKYFFDAVDGAYTTFTAMELEKGTFNVKAVIRDLLIEKLGRENIPKANETENQTIRFKVCPNARFSHEQFVDLQCKFSKADKDEMTIYFSKAQVNEVQVGADDYWYLYFEDGSNVPVIGMLSATLWNDLFALVEDPDQESPVEEYEFKVEDLEIKEEAMPERLKVVSTENTGSTTASMSVEEAARREKRRKIRGNRGEDVAIEIERKRLKDMGREDLISRIIPVAKTKDGLGYDIVSVDVDDAGREYDIYIEVKATTGDATTPFFVSRRELLVSQERREFYYLYRIYKLTNSSKEVKFFKAKGAIDDNFDLIPSTYIAQSKS